MDIEKFYPRILSARSARIIRRMWEESDIVMDSIDIDTLSRYLGIHMKKEDVIEEGFEELLYTRKRKEKKKKKAVKKVGRKYIRNRKLGKNSKENKNKENDKEEMDTNMSCLVV